MPTVRQRLQAKVRSTFLGAISQETNTVYSDVLTRHIRSCNGPDKSGVALVSWTAGPGNVRRKACHRCVRLKRRCNLKSPCGTCLEQQKHCEYPANARRLRKDVKQPATEKHIHNVTMDQSNTSESSTAYSCEDVVSAENDFARNRPSSSPPAHTECSGNTIFDVSSTVTPTSPTQRCSRSTEEKGRSQVADYLVSLSLLPPFPRDPAVSFSFLARFTHDGAGLVYVFESDAVLQTLRKASMKMLSQGRRGVSGPCDIGLDDETAIHPMSMQDDDMASYVWPEHQDCPQSAVELADGSSNDTITALDFDSDDLSSLFNRSPITKVTDVQLNRYEPALLTSPWWRGDEIAIKTFEICRALRRTVIEAQAGGSAGGRFSWSPLTEAACQDFFSPPKIRIFLEAYWSIWSPNCPVVHRPTFDILTTPTTLLTAMVLLGACHSPSSADRVNARCWFDYVEELVFNDPYITLAVSSNSDCRWSRHAYNRRRMVQAIQAAYAVCIYQNWDGSHASQLRIRRQRFNEMVAVARALGFSSARHPDLTDLRRSTFDWREFILTEEMIRTLLWVYLLDSAFVIFNNMPPRLALRELGIGLACSEACFQAEDPSSCFNYLKLWGTRVGRPRDTSLYSLIKSFCSGTMDSGRLDRASHEGFMNMWCVVGSFHIMIFNLEPSIAPKAQFAHIRMGLENWKAVWNQRTLNDDERFFDVPITTGLTRNNSKDNSQKEPQEANRQLTQPPPHHIPEDEPSMWKRSGFWRHAPEYWLLANLYLDRMEYGISVGPDGEGAQNFDPRPQHDETSMSWLRDLITKF
ncbi:hypothetical protein LTR20_010968 [Exophiala xenobiotica]|nr:hypothetical protein LTR92_007904 [Exophiala xenobiotica]KAK5358565.1 hypothetical protein LTS13_010890 [Exophiala xenobiotica]KAK5391845.1 hypothetical protein LTR79_010643 [Exophiala xenobiotica]KAK5411432.1 hypothetical protein LTR90_007806 [Exophiala xenobiotica]KAK5433372.1 hypothetical protein LTR18_010812 [Exophiala xenobiotica]